MNCENSIKITKYTKKIIELVNDAPISKIFIKNGKPHHKKDFAVEWKSLNVKEFWHEGIFYKNKREFDLMLQIKKDYRNMRQWTDFQEE